MDRTPFSTELLGLAHGEPGALQAAACAALRLWALLGDAMVQADAQRDDRLSFRLSLINAALSLPERDRAGAD